MIKKIIPFLIVLSLFIGFPLAPVFAKTTSNHTVAKTTKKTLSKRKGKKSAKKEVLSLTPDLITLETAPHSGKPISKYKSKQLITNDRGHSFPKQHDFQLWRQAKDIFAMRFCFCLITTTIAGS